MHRIALGLAVALGSAVAQSPAAPDAAFTEAVQTFQRASLGEESQVDPAIAAFEALVRADPRSPVYAAYLGSANAMKARDVWMPWNKLKYAEQGLDHIDRALEMLAPEHDRQLLRGSPMAIETRLIAARTFLKVPDAIYHRRAAGKRLVAGLFGHPAFAAAPAPLRAAVHLAAAEAARGERPEEEVAQLRAALTLTESGASAEQARARLKELGQ